MEIKSIIIGAIGLLLGGAIVLGVGLVQHSTPPLGALSNTDFPSNWYGVGQVYTWKTRGSCASGTSTIFAVQNPWSATSTLDLAIIGGIQGATTTDILVGTSTTPSPAGLAVATSSVGSNIFGLFSVTANSNFFSVAGATMGSSKGYTSPNSGTYPTSQARVVLGPNDYVLGFSTSTNPVNNGGTGSSQLGLPSSCTYELVFTRGS